MNPQSLLHECAAKGVSVRAVGGKLKLRGEPEAVQVALNRLRPHKKELLAYLQERRADSAQLWLAMIHELSGLVSDYCDRLLLCDQGSKEVILRTVLLHPKITIPESLAWFRQEINGERA